MAPQALCHLLPSPLASYSPARLLPLLPFFLFFIFIAICSSAGAVPQGERHVETKTTEETGNQYLKKPPVHGTSEHDSENEAKLIEQAASSDGRNDCYALEFSKNMSTLLSEASHMLGRVKNSRERNWLKAFIRRLTSLADDLLEHPEVRKSECLFRNQKTKSSSDKSEKDWNSKSKNTITKNHVPLTQKDIPARRSHMPGHVEVENPSQLPPQNQSTLITKPETNHGDFVTEEMSKIDGGSKLDNSDDLVQQLRIGPPGITDSTVPQQEHPHGMIDVKVWNPPKATYETTSSADSSKNSVTSPQATPLKDEVLQKLLGEMASQVQKLKDLGGTEEDVLNLWKENGPKTPLPVVEVTPSPEVEHDIPDFGYDEQGAATGELRPDDSQQDLIVAPSVNKVVSTMSSIPIVSSSSGLDVMNEFYPTSKPALEDQSNDEDDLVRQLQEEKFLSEAAPKSASPDHLYPEKDSQSDNLVGVPLKKFDMGPIFG